MLAAHNTPSDKSAGRSIETFPPRNDDTTQHHRRLTLDMQRVASEDSRHRLLRRQRSNESMHSTVSVGSIFMGTAGKLTKWPNAVKSSVKGFVGKSRGSHRPDDVYYHTEPGFGNMFRKRTPSVMGLTSMFSRRRTSMGTTNTTPEGTDTVTGTNHTSSENAQGTDSTKTSTPMVKHSNCNTQPRISMIDEEVDTTTSLQKLSLNNNSHEHSAGGVGSLLFGKEIDSLFTPDPSPHKDEPTSVSQISGEHGLIRDEDLFQQSQNTHPPPAPHTDPPKEDDDSPAILPRDGYKIERGRQTGAASSECPVPIVSKLDYSQYEVQHMDDDASWFRIHYLNNDYATFCGMIRDEKPVLITAIYSEGQYRLIMRSKESPDIRKTVHDSFLLNAPPPTPVGLGKQPNPVSNATWKSLIELSFDIPYSDLAKFDTNLVVSSGIESDILKLDEISIHSRYKFGVLFVKEGQTKEEEWFSNQHSEKLERFLNIIGDRIALQGYTGWAAGLDTKGGDSGEYTYISTWDDHTVAYHVSTLIPSKSGDKQQIQRKRHIGNDIVCIVFVDGQQPFNPATIKSQFLHVFIVVREEVREGRMGWRVEVATVESVPAFGPALPENAMFFDETELRSFMLAKLINAEYAALKSPKFAQPMARAREGILTNIVERGLKLTEERGGGAKSRHSKSPSTSSERSQHSQDVSPTTSRSSMLKEFSEVVAGLGRHRSIQLSHDGSESRQRMRQRRTRGKDVDVSKRSQSELDLTRRVPPTSNMSASRSSAAVLQGSGTSKEDKGLKHRAQNVLVAFNLGGRRTTHREDDMPLPLTL